MSVIPVSNPLASPNSTRSLINEIECLSINLEEWSPLKIMTNNHPIICLSKKLVATLTIFPQLLVKSCGFRFFTK